MKLIENIFETPLKNIVPSLLGMHPNLKTERIHQILHVTFKILECQQNGLTL
jgi:hypothetical protein